MPCLSSGHHPVLKKGRLLPLAHNWNALLEILPVAIRAP